MSHPPGACGVCIDPTAYDKVPSMARTTFGAYLVQQKVVDPQQVDEAVNAQVLFGGRLGTNLLELGYLDERNLARHLSRYHKVKAVDPLNVGKIPDELIDIIPKKIAMRFQVIPYHVEKKRLHLLCTSPWEFEQIKEIEFSTGHRVSILVIPEVRFFALLEKYYGVKRDIRFITLAMRASKALKRKKAEEEARQSPGSAKPSLKEQLFETGGGDLMSEDVFQKSLERFAPFNTTEIQVVDGAKALEEEEEILELGDGDFEAIEEEDFDSAAARISREFEEGGDPIAHISRSSAREAHKAAEDENYVSTRELISETVGEEAAATLEEEVGAGWDESDFEEAEIFEEAPPPPPRPLTREEAARRLDEAKSRDDISQTVLGFSMSYFERAALFIVRQNLILGWDAMGQNMDRQTIHSLMIPLGTPSVFKLVHDSFAHFLGTLPPNPVNDQFLKIMGGGRPKSVFLIPILFRGKVVNILYGDNGHGRDAPTDISDLLILAPRIPQTFERLVRERKNI